MKKIHIILLLALGLGVSSCFSCSISNKRVLGVLPGVARGDVAGDACFDFGAHDNHCSVCQ